MKATVSKGWTDKALRAKTEDAFYPALAAALATDPKHTNRMSWEQLMCSPQKTNRHILPLTTWMCNEVPASAASTSSKKKGKAPEPPLESPAEAWLSYASCCLGKVMANPNSAAKEVRTLVSKACFGVRVARLLTPAFIANPLFCWDATREKTLLETGNDGAALLCLLLEYNDWKKVGDFLFSEQYFRLSFFAYSIHKASFDASEHMLALSKDERRIGNKMFYAASAVILKESPQAITHLASELVKQKQSKWAAEVLCVSYDIWSASPELKGTCHDILMKCFKSQQVCEVDEAVLIAGEIFLASNLDHGSHSQRRYEVLMTIRSQNTKRSESPELAPFLLIRGIPDLMVAFLLKCYREKSVDMLEMVDTSNVSSMSGPEVSLPEYEKFVRILPRALLQLLHGEGIKGVQMLHDLLLNMIVRDSPSVHESISKLLSEVSTRSLFLISLDADLREANTVTSFLSLTWISDCLSIPEDNAPPPFRFRRVFRRSPLLRVLRHTEVAVDSVASRDGHFEAAMSLLDLMQVCPGTHALLGVLLRAAKHLDVAAARGTDRAAPDLPRRHACVSLAKEVLHLVEHRYMCCDKLLLFVLNSFKLRTKSWVGCLSMR